jgi:hypothetical protein
VLIARRRINNSGAPAGKTALNNHNLASSLTHTHTLTHSTHAHTTHTLPVQWHHQGPFQLSRHEIRPFLLHTRRWGSKVPVKVCCLAVWSSVEQEWGSWGLADPTARLHALPLLTFHSSVNNLVHGFGYGACALQERRRLQGRYSRTHNDGLRPRKDRHYTGNMSAPGLNTTNIVPATGQNPAENRGPIVYTVTTILLVLSTIFIILRLISRLGVVKRFALDDYVIVFAWVSWSLR